MYSEASMAKKKAKSTGRVSEKVAKSYRLSPRRIAAAQKILGTPNATATIEEALDLVVFREELLTGIRGLRRFGAIEEVFPDNSFKE
jgi:hypothetical protein